MDTSLFWFLSVLAVLFKAGQAVEGEKEKVSFRFVDKYDEKVRNNNAFVNIIKPQIARLMDVQEARLTEFRISKIGDAIGVSFVLLPGASFQNPSNTAIASLKSKIQSGTPNFKGLNDDSLNVEKDSFTNEKLVTPGGEGGSYGMPMEGIIALAIVAACVIILFIICLVCTKSSNCLYTSPESYSRMKGPPTLMRARAWHNKYDQENRGDFVFLYDDPPQIRRENKIPVNPNPSVQTISDSALPDRLPEVRPAADYHIWARSADGSNTFEPGKIITNNTQQKKEKIDPKFAQLLLSGTLTLGKSPSTELNAMKTTVKQTQSVPDSEDASEIGILVNQPGKPDSKIIPAKVIGLDRAPPYVASQATYLRGKKKRWQQSAYASLDNRSLGYRNRLPPFLYAQYQHYHTHSLPTARSERSDIPRVHRVRGSMSVEQVKEVKQVKRIRSKPKYKVDGKRPGIIQDAIWEEKNDKRASSIEHVHQPQKLSTKIPDESLPDENFKTSTALKPIYVNTIGVVERYVAEGEDDHQSSASYHMSQVEEVHIEQTSYPLPPDVQEEEVDENPVAYSADVDGVEDDDNDSDGNLDNEAGGDENLSYLQAKDQESVQVYPTMHNSTSELGGSSQVSAPNYLPVIQDTAPVDSVEPQQDGSIAGSRISNRSSGIPSAASGRPASSHRGSKISQAQSYSVHSSTAASLNQLPPTREEDPQTSENVQDPQTSGNIPAAPPFMLMSSIPAAVGNDDDTSNLSPASGEPLWDPGYQGASRPVSDASFMDVAPAGNNNERTSQSWPAPPSADEIQNMSNDATSRTVTELGEHEFSHPHHIILGIPDADGVQRNSIAQIIGEDGQVLNSFGNTAVGHIAGEVSQPLSQMDLAY